MQIDIDIAWALVCQRSDAGSEHSIDLWRATDETGVEQRRRAAFKVCGLDNQIEVGGRSRAKVAVDLGQ